MGLVVFQAALIGGVLPGAEPKALLPADGQSVTAANFSSLSKPKMHWAADTFSKDPSVVRFKGRYLLYFSFPPMIKDGHKYGWTTGIAESTDLIHWRQIGNLLPMQKCDQKGLCAPCAKVFNNKVYLFYQTYGNGPADAICCAWSSDGIHFTPHPENPIFRPVGPEWTNGRAIDADVIEFNGKYFLFAATRDPKGTVQKIVVATAPLNTDFGPGSWKQAADFSILEPLLPWEGKCIEAPTAFVKDGKLYMFYAGGYNNFPQQIGLAVSNDGIHWQRVWNVPFLPNGPQGQWNSSESGHPGYFEDENGQSWLFFQGNATNGKDWYLSRLKLDWIKKNGLTLPYAVEE